MYRLALVVLALTVSAGTAVSAEQRSAMESQERFQSLDKDGNGYISHDEAKDQHRVFWYYQSADQNSDGAVDESEFSAFEEQVPDVGNNPQQ